MTKSVVAPMPTHTQKEIDTAKVRWAAKQLKRFTDKAHLLEMDMTDLAATLIDVREPAKTLKGYDSFSAQGVKRCDEAVDLVLAARNNLQKVITQMETLEVLYKFMVHQEAFAAAGIVTERPETPQLKVQT